MTGCLSLPSRVSSHWTALAIRTAACRHERAEIGDVKMHVMIFVPIDPAETEDERTARESSAMVERCPA
eukprot:COSAG06_NODE_28970_length_564_cov_2.393548_2_plen_68_part_01